MESNDDLNNMCKKLHLDRDKLIHINKTNHEERLTKNLSKYYQRYILMILNI